MLFKKCATGLLELFDFPLEQFPGTIKSFGNAINTQKLG